MRRPWSSHGVIHIRIAQAVQFATVREGNSVIRLVALECMTARMASLVGGSLFIMSMLVPLSYAAADGYWHDEYWNSRYYDEYNDSYYDHPEENYWDDHYFNNSYSYPYGYSNSYTYGYAYTYPYNSYTHYTQPSCTISLSNYSRVNGYPPSATLSWWSSGATSAYLSSVGSVATSDTRAVYPYGQNYTLTVYGPGGSGTCYAANTDVAYQHDYYNTYTYGYYTAPVQTYSYSYAGKPYVHLEKLPYTGFDGGPILNSLYWAVLLGFALVGSYLMFYTFGMRIALVENVAQAAHNQIGLVKRAIQIRR